MKAIPCPVPGDSPRKVSLAKGIATRKSERRKEKKRESRKEVHTSLATEPNVHSIPTRKDKKSIWCFVIASGYSCLA
jgi:hypothetical protein